MEGDLCQDQLQPASNRFVSVSSLLSVLCTVYCVLCTVHWSQLSAACDPALSARPGFSCLISPGLGLTRAHSDAISPSLRSWEVTTSIICETRDQVLEETIIPFLFIVQLELWSVY